jgi:hypothetical protein
MASFALWFFALLGRKVYVGIARMDSDPAQVDHMQIAMPC